MNEYAVYIKGRAQPITIRAEKVVTGSGAFKFYEGDDSKVAEFPASSVDGYRVVKPAGH